MGEQERSVGGVVGCASREAGEGQKKYGEVPLWGSARDAEREMKRERCASRGSSREGERDEHASWE